MDNHLAGVGTQGQPSRADQKGQPGYEGFLNFRVAALAELMTDAGYNSYMTGKWHLGPDVENGPHARGFRHSFVSLDGAAHLGGWDWRGPQPANYRDGDEIVLLDITATAESRNTLLDTVRRTARQLFIPFTVGGGIRSLDDAAAVLDCGADKVAMNSAAIDDPALITHALGVIARAVDEGSGTLLHCSWLMFPPASRTGRPSTIAASAP